MSHARLAPSGGDQWPNCPGAPNAQVGLVDLPREDAQQGTCTHWGLEQALKFHSPVKEFVGTVLFLDTLSGEVYVLNESLPIPSREFKFYQYYDEGLALTGHLWTFTQEMADVAQVAATHAYKMADQLQADITPERRVNPGKLLERDDCTGTVDITVLKAVTTFQIWDLKAGWTPVTAAKRGQLILYAIGVLAEMAVEARAKIETVTLGIIQPSRGEGREIDSWTISISTLWAWIEWFKRAAAKTDDPNAPRLPGKLQCKWCLAAATCPEYRTLIMEDVLEIPPEKQEDLQQIVPMGEVATTREPSDLNLEQISKLLQIIPLARDWLKAVESHATQLAISGTPISGHKVVLSDTRRRWVEEDDVVVKKLTVNYKIPKAEATKPEVPISPARATKLIKAKKISDRKMKNFNSMIYKPDGKPTLVPVSDPRPALAVTVDQMIEGLEVSEEK